MWYVLRKEASTRFALKQHFWKVVDYPTANPKATKLLSNTLVLVGLYSV
jgi:hypothetical protein